METAPRGRWLLLVAGRIPFYVAIPLSLLCFPSAIPWMILLWIAVYAVQAYRRKPAWLPPLIALSVVLVKHIDWPPNLTVLVFSLAMLSAIEWRRPKLKPIRPAWLYPLVPLFAIILLWTFFTVDWHRSSRRSDPLVPRPHRPIVVIGDSLSVHGWPGELAKQVSVRVIDRSEGGINTIEGLAKLPEALALRPQLLVIELGGHDYLEQRGRDATKANLEEIVRRAREAGAEVLLFEIPRGFVMDGFGGLERELAREHDLELVTDGAIRQLVLFSPFTPLGSLTGRKLSDDGLHPNAEGHRFLAGRVKESLVRLYGTSILSSGR